MKIGKASQDDLTNLRKFLLLAEGVMAKQPYGLTEPEDNWLEWDDDDEDKVAILKIKKYICKNEEIEPEELDNRILMFEFLRRKFAAAASGYMRVYYAAAVLIDEVCDPTESFLAYHPMFEEKHVENEQ